MHGGSAAEAPRYAPGTRISYDSHLIEQLLADHRELLALFTDIHDAFKAGDLARTTRGLHRFKSGIQAHLLTEQIRLYVYLEYTLANDKLSHGLMHSMHREMDVIGRNVLHFLDKYSALEETPMLRNSFAADLDQLGAVLVERIKREESTLYSLYMPPAELATN